MEPLQCLGRNREIERSRESQQQGRQPPQPPNKNNQKLALFGWSMLEKLDTHPKPGRKEKTTNTTSAPQEDLPPQSMTRATKNKPTQPTNPGTTTPVPNWNHLQSTQKHTRNLVTNKPPTRFTTPEFVSLRWFSIFLSASRMSRMAILN